MQQITKEVDQLFVRRAALERLVRNADLDPIALKIAGSRIGLAVSETRKDVLERTSESLSTAIEFYKRDVLQNPDPERWHLIVQLRQDLGRDYPGHYLCE